MNIHFFILQTLTITICTLLAFRIGKEALITFIALLCVLSNLFVLKQITILGFHTTAAESFSVGALFGLHLIHEYWGKLETKKTIWICFFSLLVYTILSQLHLLYEPSKFDLCSEHFCNLLHYAPRLTIVSLLAYFIVQNLDQYLYGRLLKQFGHNFLFIRNYALLLLMQLIDTILFGILGLYGIVHSVWHVIFVSFWIKAFAVTLTAPFTIIAKKLFRPTFFK